MEIKSETGCVDGWIRGHVIGTGSFATVSIAINNSNGELFAVKTMKTDSKACLENEYNILKSLDSPYIVRCLGKDYTVHNGVAMCNLMMEYMPGGCVADLISNSGGKFEESVIRSYTQGILRGIDYLHRQGIVHSDIKGKNVLVGTGGVVKLGDFGSATRTASKGSSVKDVRGTPLWMAPEVINQLEQGLPSDIWSLGCTVLEMTTGKPPWSNVSNPLAAMYCIGCTHELPDLPPCLSVQARDFVEKCLRRDPNQRWTAAQLLSHPYLNQYDWFSASTTEVKRGSQYPPSALDSWGPYWDPCSSSLSGTVPILSLENARPIREVVEEEKNISNKRPSPRERIAALAAGCQKPDFICKPSQWRLNCSESQVFIVK